MEANINTTPSPIRRAARLCATEFDMLFAALFVSAYMSPTLSALFRVNTILPTVALFGMWLLSFCINTFAIKRREGGVRRFIKDIFASPRRWELLMLAIWVVLLAVNALMGRGVNGHIAFAYYSIFMAMALLDFFYSLTGEGWKTRVVIYIALAIFALDYLRGSIALINEGSRGPWISRQLSTAQYTDEQRRAFMLSGIGGYEVNTGMSILAGVFLLFILRAKRRWPLVLMFIICMLGVFLSGYAFPVAFTCVTLFAAAVYSWARARKGGRDRKIVPLVMLAVVAAFAALTALAYPLNIYPAQIYADKVGDVYQYEIRDRVYALLGQQPPADAPEGDAAPAGDDAGAAQTDGAADPAPAEQAAPDENAAAGNATEEPPGPVDFVLEKVVTPELLGDATKTGLGPVSTRLLLYKQSWVTFTENIAFGVGPVVNDMVMGVGGHSTWADYFATFGLQFVFFVAFVVCMGIRVMRGTRGMERFFRMLSFFIFVGYAFINPVISHKVFPVVLCLMACGNLPEDGMGYVGQLKPATAAGRKGSKADAPNNIEPSESF